MASYLVVLLNLHDPSWIEDYIAKVPTIIRSYGGEYLFVSKGIARYEGDIPIPDQIAVFTFPSKDALEAFLKCPEYAPYKDARIAGSTATIFGVES